LRTVCMYTNSGMSALARWEQAALFPSRETDIRPGDKQV
jgi:hypothetical protein